MLNLDDFKKAHKSISPYINYTPLIHSLALSKNLEVYLKLECLQVTGSFKLRGATNKLLSLTNEQKNKGVNQLDPGTPVVDLKFNLHYAANAGDTCVEADFTYVSASEGTHVYVRTNGGGDYDGPNGSS